MSKYYVVIDTNVIVSSLLKKDSIPRLALEFCMFCNDVTIILNNDIYGEYDSVLRRKKFGFDEYTVDNILKNILANSIYIKSDEFDLVFEDKSDVKFYELTLTGKKEKESFLLTGNKKHFPNEYFVMNPREFLNMAFIKYNLSK